jgi:hypothetical protein
MPRSSHLDPHTTILLPILLPRSSCLDSDIFVRRGHLLSLCPVCQSCHSNLRDLSIEPPTRSYTPNPHLLTKPRTPHFLSAAFYHRVCPAHALHLYSALSPQSSALCLPPSAFCPCFLPLLPPTDPPATLPANPLADPPAYLPLPRSSCRDPPTATLPPQSSCRDPPAVTLLP